MLRTLFLFVLLLSVVVSASGRLLLAGGGAGYHGDALQLVYQNWNDTMPGWTLSTTYTGAFLLPEDNDLKGANDVVASIGVGVSFLWFNYTGLTPDLGMGMTWGTEEVDNQYRNFFAGIQAHQRLVWVPKGYFGIATGFGLYQAYNFNSELLPWDSGVNIFVGLKF